MADFTVHLMPSNQSFTVKKGELILDAAIRQDIKVPYSCRNGTCRTCLFEVKDGYVQQEDVDLCMISEQELEANRRLICMSLCRSDAILEKASPRRQPRAALEG
jgi:ferredoxin